MNIKAFVAFFTLFQLNILTSNHNQKNKNEASYGLSFSQMICGRQHNKSCECYTACWTEKATMSQWFPHSIIFLICDMNLTAILFKYLAREYAVKENPFNPNWGFML